MIGGIYAQSLYFNNYQYGNTVRRADGQVNRTEAADKTNQVQAAGRTGKVVAVSRAANPGAPVEPVDPVPVVTNESSSGIGRMIPFMRKGADPVEMAVRMRMEQYDPSKDSQTAAVQGSKSAAIAGQAMTNEAEAGIEGVLKAAEEGECQTCEQRKYQDGSDDPGVSFKTASHIAPEQAKAKREERKVVSQSVSIHTDICPECGKVYVSGGTTRTVTSADSKPEQESGAQQRKPFFAVA